MINPLRKLIASKAEQVAQLVALPSPPVNGLKQACWSTIAGKTIKSYGLVHNGVAMTFTDGTYVAVEFRGPHVDANTNPTTDPASCYLNRALLGAGVVTQAQVDTAIAAIEAKKRQIEGLQRELRDHGR